MFTLLFQTVSASLICPVMPSVHSRWNICGIICFKSFKNDHLKNPVSPQLFCCSKSLHDANMVVRLSFVVFLWLLGRWVKVGKGCRLVCGQGCQTRQANLQSESVNYLWLCIKQCQTGELRDHIPAIHESI